jgi:transposase
MKPTKGYSKGYQRLLGLGTEKVAAIDSMLIEGISPTEVARFIQDEYKEFLDVHMLTLAKQLARYKKDRLSVKITAIGSEAGKLKTEAVQALTKLQSKLDVVDSIETVIHTQLKRVNKLLDQENNMPLPLAQTNKELDLLLSNLFKLADLQMELGVLARISPKNANFFAINFSQQEQDLLARVQRSQTVGRATMQALDVLGITDAEYVEDQDGDENGSDNN